MNEEIKPLKIFVGYDSREDIAYEVCKQSILQTASVPVEIIPLKLDKLRSQNWYWREEDKLGSTEFTFSRFMVPFLTDYSGWALFIDCDFVFKEDIAELFSLANDKYAVMCAHHDYTPRPGEKMDGQAQLPYPRKNWSSLMMFNCSHPDIKKLSVKNINAKNAKWLHRFEWTSDECVGEIPATFNWLEGWYNDNINPKAIHYTRGGPWHTTWNGQYKDKWVETYNKLVKEKSNG